MYFVKVYFQGDVKMSEKFDMPDRWYSTKEICAYLDKLLVEKIWPENNHKKYI